MIGLCLYYGEMLEVPTLYNDCSWPDDCVII